VPELPEVQTIVSDLDELISNQIIEKAEIYWPKSVAHPSNNLFMEKIKKLKIHEVSRIGKYILMKLSGNCYLIIHLRMTGQFLIRKKHDPIEKYLKIRIFLNNNQELRFCDLRKFGRIWLLNEQEYLNFQNINKLGPDPTAKNFSFKKFSKILKETKKQIKPFLLDQTNLSGLGNIYVDESLFLAGIHPIRAISSLKNHEKKKLYSSIRKVLSKAIEKRGTSDRDYLDALGRVGEFKHFLNVYKRKDENCRKCQAKIQYMKLAQRGTHFCPYCQK